MSNRLCYDVVIVGAGPVGIATAIALHQAHFSVAIVEKYDYHSNALKTSGMKNPPPDYTEKPAPYEKETSQKVQNTSLLPMSFLDTCASFFKICRDAYTPFHRNNSHLKIGQPTTNMDTLLTAQDCSHFLQFQKKEPSIGLEKNNSTEKFSINKPRESRQSKNENTETSNEKIETETSTFTSVQPPTKWFALGVDILQWLESLGFDLPYEPVTHLILSCQDQSPDIILNSALADEPFLTGVIHSAVLNQQGYQHAAGIDHFSPDEIISWNLLETEAEKGDYLEPEYFDPEFLKPNFLPSQWHLMLASGKTLVTPLVIGADGGNSSVRAFFDPVVVRCDFRQKAVVFLLDCVPTGYAYEHFFPNGSLAVLSLRDGKGAGIWMGPEKDIPALADISDVVWRMLGLRSTILPNPSIFDVQGHWVGQKIFKRCALIGDAAHALHPIAGQGLNLGLRNARLLCDQITERRRLGLDWGLGLDALKPTWELQTTALHVGTTGLVATLCGIDPSAWWSLGSTILSWDWAKRWLIHTAAGKMMDKNPLSPFFTSFFDTRSSD